jgi:hypothetical protein
MSFDDVHNHKVLPAILPATITGSTDGIVIDTAGYESLTFDILAGAFSTFTGSNKWTFKVQEGAIAEGTDMADIAAADYLGSYKGATAGWDKVMDAADDDDMAFSIGVRINTMRYKRLVLTEAGTVSAIVAATARLGHPRHLPVGNTD